MTGSGPDRLLDDSGALPQAAPPWPGRDRLRVTAVRAIVTAPEGMPLVVVRVDTSEPGLYGLGCATFTQRYAAVVAAVEEHVGPLVVGRHPADIEDITRMIHYSSYWRGGPVLGNALSGVDQALWDIAGKRAGMPVYELLGGRSRSAVEVYSHAAGGTVEETLAEAEELLARGYRHVRLQVGGPGLGTYGAPGTRGGYPRSPHPDGWDVAQYLRATPEALRGGAGAAGRGGEPDARRAQPADPEAGGGPRPRTGAVPAVVPGGRDRAGVLRPAAGGARRVAGADRGRRADRQRHGRGTADQERRDRPAAAAHLRGRRPDPDPQTRRTGRTARRAHRVPLPGDISPVGVAANLAVDISTPAFGYQESHTYNDATHEVFPGTPVVREGHLAPSDAPGWGVDLDEKAAVRFPPTKFLHERWATGVRHPDGSLNAP